MNTDRLITAARNTFNPITAIIAAALLGFNIGLDMVERHSVSWGINLLCVVCYLATMYLFNWFKWASSKQ